LIKRKIFILTISFTLLLDSNVIGDSFKEDLINKLISTKTLTFNFKQNISNKVESGNCFIKYPLLMKCNYQNLKQKIVISNGKTVAVIKKKYKKIYYYPIKTTPLFFLLQKEKIIDLIKKNDPSSTNSELIEFLFIDKRKNKIKVFFDKKSLELKGWETNDAYSNFVSFEVIDLKINNQITDSFFTIPQESDL